MILSYFNTLEKKDIRKIVDIELVHLIVNRIDQLGYQNADLLKPQKILLQTQGYDSKYGARPLNRAIQKYLEDLIAEHIVVNNVH